MAVFSVLTQTSCGTPASSPRDFFLFLFFFFFDVVRKQSWERHNSRTRKILVPPQQLPHSLSPSFSSSEDVASTQKRGGDKNKTNFRLSLFCLFVSVYFPENEIRRWRRINMWEKRNEHTCKKKRYDEARAEFRVECLHELQIPSLPEKWTRSSFPSGRRKCLSAARPCFSVKFGFFFLLSRRNSCRFFYPFSFFGGLTLFHFSITFETTAPDCAKELLAVRKM